MEAIKNAFDFSDFPLDRTVAGPGAVFLLSVSRCLPHSSFAMATMIQFLMFSVYGMGWNTIGGYGGQVDLGKAQYVGIGAYTTAVMMIRWDVPFWVSMPIGMAFCRGLELYHRLSVVPAEGPLFAIATIATSLILKDLFESWSFVGGGPGPGNFAHQRYAGFPASHVPAGLSTTITLSGPFFSSASFIMNWFRKSRIGFQLRCLKDNEEVARSLGSTPTGPRSRPTRSPPLL